MDRRKRSIGKVKEVREIEGREDWNRLGMRKRRGEQKVNDERKSIGEIRSDDQRRRRV